MIFRGIFGLVALFVLRILLEAFNFSRPGGKDKTVAKEEGLALKLLLIYAGLFLFAWIYFLPGVQPPTLSFWMDTSALDADDLETAKLQARTALGLAALPLAFDLIVLVIASAFKRWNKSVMALALAVDLLGLLGFWFGLSHLVQP
ncbi:MAG: hypothetical protein EBY26_05305 [Microbacteriaceae bacterium]|nr:hypothetical protein [Microbacteriaceae bacterium]